MRLQKKPETTLQELGNDSPIVASAFYGCGASYNKTGACLVSLDSNRPTREPWNPVNS